MNRLVLLAGLVMVPCLVDATAPPTAPPFVVVIDPGHGGKDSGAIGAQGTLEKEVVLDIARKLRELMRREPGLKGLLTRQDDRFLTLRQRAELAHQSGAHLFVSLHADAFDTPMPKGSSVFVLSEHGASSEMARLLADRENAGAIGGVDLAAEDALVASVLADLSKNATRESSDRAAEWVMNSLAKDFRLHHSSVQKAGFKVLKSLDVPSLLIELGFLSSHEEEKRLKDPKWQERLARAILTGILSYKRQAGGVFHEPGRKTPPTPPRPMSRP